MARLAAQRQMPARRSVCESSIFRPNTTNWAEAVEVTLDDKMFLIMPIEFPVQAWAYASEMRRQCNASLLRFESQRLSPLAGLVVMLTPRPTELVLDIKPTLPRSGGLPEWKGTNARSAVLPAPAQGP